MNENEKNVLFLQNLRNDLKILANMVVNDEMPFSITEKDEIKKNISDLIYLCFDAEIAFKNIAKNK